MRTDPSKIIPTSDDTAEQWIEWHKSLSKWFSKNEANTQWLRFWNQRAGAGTQADTHDLRAYMSEQGVSLTTDMSGAFTDSVMDTMDWLGESANWLRGIIIGALIIAIGLVAFWVINRTIKGKSLVPNPIGMRNALRSPNQLLLS